MKKVCVLTTAHPCFDSRIFYKECKTLSDAGYDVSLIVTHDKEETINGIRIIPLPEGSGRLYRMFIKKWICFKKALKEDAAIYHLHDPELIDVGFILGLLRKNVVYDVHEDIRKQIMNKTWLGNITTRRIISGIYNIIEKLLLSDYSLIVAATDTIAGYYPESKTVTVKNYVIKKYIDDAAPADASPGEDGRESPDKDGLEGHISDYTRLIYAGGLTPIRGIREMIDAAGIANAAGYKVRLTLLGRWESDYYKNLCNESNGIEYVDYLGVKPMTEVYSYMKSSDIGLATLYPDENYLMSLPIKAFEYMASGIPIIMSDFPFWKELFGSCALFVDPKNPTDIAVKTIFLIKDKSQAKELGQSGRALVDETYSWEKEKSNLIEGYARFNEQAASK